MAESFKEVENAGVKAAKQAEKVAKQAEQTARQPLQRDEKGRFLPRGVPGAPPKPPPPALTALDQLEGGKPKRDLDDMAARGRALRERNLERARRIAEDFRIPLKGFQRFARGARDYARGTAGALAQSAPSMAATGLNVMTGNAAGAMRAGGAIAGSLAGAFGLTGVAGALPFGGQLAGALLNTRMRRIGQVTRLERGQTELALSGAQGVRGARGIFAGMGISGAEGVNALRSFQRSIGARGPLLNRQNIGGTASFLAQASLRGIDPGSIGRFIAGGAVGGGAVGNQLESARLSSALLGEADLMGLSGAGATRFLSTIAQNTARIASEGLQVDEEGAAQFIKGISAAAGEMGRKQLQGVGAALTFQRFGGALGGISGGFSGQFGGLARGALTAAAAQGGGGPLDVLRRLEEFRTSPAQAVTALREQGLEGDLLELALSGLGLSTQQAGVLARATPAELETTLSGRGLGKMRAGMQFSRMTQTAQERLTRRVEADPASAKAIISLNTRLEELALAQTAGNTTLMKIFNTIEPTINTLVSTLGDIRETLNRLKRFL